MQDARGSKVVGGGAAQTKAEQKQRKWPATSFSF